MEKRLVLAIALSLLVLLSWSAISSKSQNLGNKGFTSANLPLNTGVSSGIPSEVNVVPVGTETPPQSETVTFNQGLMEIVFNPRSASITEVIFKDTIEHRMPLLVGMLSTPLLPFKLQKQTRNSITFVAEDQKQRIIKTFTIPNSSYVIELHEQIINLTNAPQTVNSTLAVGRVDLANKTIESRYRDVFAGIKDKNLHLSIAKDFSSLNGKFIGLRDQYFCTIVEPDKLAHSVYVKKISPKESEIGLNLGQESIKPGMQIGHLYRIYLGPQDLKILNSINLEWAGIIYFGTFDFIAQLLLQLLSFFYAIAHNWGLAIIILSIAVYLLLFPLSMKQMRSMKEMQALQPKIEALRKQYKDNPQKLNKEVMELYKEHKVNPLSGCLPLLLQMPIFFALYQGLMRSVALRGAKFLWIQDLSSPDRAFTLKTALPFLGNSVNILPILMAIGMFVQQKISMSKATAGETAQQQQIMSIIMPVMFGVIFYQMPSGLVLYWFVNSVLMLTFQLKINRQR